MNYNFLLISFLLLPTISYGMNPDLEAGPDTENNPTPHLNNYFNQLPLLVGEAALAIMRRLIGAMPSDEQQALEIKVNSFVENHTGENAHTFIQGELLVHEAGKNRILTQNNTFLSDKIRRYRCANRFWRYAACCSASTNITVLLFVTIYQLSLCQY